ncbi:MAG TPA: ABC transporter permease [Candidatus Angelobacter sp.]
MKWLSLGSSFFRNLFRHKKAEQALDDEVSSYTELLVAENMKHGLTEQEARRAARLEMGGSSQIKEEVRDIRIGAWLLTFLQDVRHGLRLLRNQPLFTLAAVLIFSIGIGANTTIFSMVNGLLMRPVPVPGSERLAYLVQKRDHWRNSFSYPDFEEVRRQAGEAFSDVAALRIFQMDGLSVSGKSQPIWTEYVTSNFFSMLEIRPAMGSLIPPSENLKSKDPVMVVSYSYWKNHLGSDPKIVGQKATLNGTPVTIIGVTPEGFTGLTPILETQGYLPLGMYASTQRQQSKDDLADPRGDGVLVFARLRDGITLGKSQSVLAVIAHRLAEENPATKKDLMIRAASLGSGMLSPDGSNVLMAASILFFVLSGLLLLLASANVANLLLVRAIGRNREMAVRSALGARRFRLVRQVLAETLLLGLLGCAGGAILGSVGSSIISRLPLQSDIPMVLDFHFDWRVLTFAVGAAVFLTLVSGLVPALRAARVNLNDTLRESSRSYSSHRQRFRTFLVVAQVGGSLMLLIVAGLFVRSLHNVQNVDLGFDPNHVINFGVDPHTAGYDDVRGREFYRELLERVRALPGVESASLAATIPMGPEDLGAADLKIEGYQEAPGQSKPSADMNLVSSSYFQTMHIPVVHGRDIQDTDTETSQRVAIISEAMAQTYWPGKDPIGRTFTRSDVSGGTWQVVGLAKNIRKGLVMAPISPAFYVPMAQDYRSRQTLQVRTSATSSEVMSQIIGLVHSMDATVPVFDVRTMTQALDSPDGFLLFRLAAVMASTMGLMGLVLAVVGVYGVISYSAAQRTHEIGIRVALGAQPVQVLKTILRQGVIIVLCGLAFGILAAIAIAKLVGSFLVDVSAVDPVTYVGVSLLLASVALLASFIPARRATRVDPMPALRCE